MWHWTSGPRGTPSSRSRNNGVGILQGASRPTGASAADPGVRPTIGRALSLPGELSPQQFAVEGGLRAGDGVPTVIALHAGAGGGSDAGADRKSTRLHSSHL